MKPVDGIIVNYRTPDLTAAAIRSLLDEPEINRVIVVENGSGDDSARRLSEEFKSEQRVQIVVEQKNQGFGGGNNRGAEVAEAPYLFFLNSDATVRPGSVGKLADRLEQEPTAGLVAPAIYLEDGKTPQPDVLGRFPTPLSILLRLTRIPGNSLEPDWISGVAFLARRSEYQELGGFDTSLFMYLEDVDLCRRYRAAGKRVLRELSAAVIHLGGRSSRSTATRKELYFKSQDRYLELSGALRLGRLLVKIARSPYLIVGRLFLWK